VTTMARGDIAASLLNLVRKDARRKSRRKALAKFISTLVLAVLMAFGNGWYLMLAVGIVHHEWIRSCPTLGYWWAVAICALLRAALLPVSTKSGTDR